MTPTSISPETGAASASILVVDDEEFLLALVREILEEVGYKVTALASSVAAFHLFSAAPSKFDLVVADEKMPVLSGIDLSEQILEIRPDVPVILHTDYPDQASVRKARAIGVRAIIGKSSNMSQLITYIRRLLQS
ncbi:MAG: response regulator [Syntrophorhabdales bacterium]|jgi:CheY-like chemotaxis protein